MRRDQRPVFLNLFQIKLPLPGLVSIAHRVSGVLLFLCLPLVLYLLSRASVDETEFENVADLLNSPAGLILLLPLAWAFWHHLLSGIRFLLMELDIGLDKKTATASAQLTMVLTLILTLISLIGWYA